MRINEFQKISCQSIVSWLTNCLTKVTQSCMCSACLQLFQMTIIVKLKNSSNCFLRLQDYYTFPLGEYITFVLWVIRWLNSFSNITCGSMLWTSDQLANTKFGRATFWSCKFLFSGCSINYWPKYVSVLAYFLLCTCSCHNNPIL